MKNKRNPFSIHRVRKNPRKRGLKITAFLKIFGTVVLTLLLTLLVYFQKDMGQWFKISVLDLPEPFNGTVMPVEQVPNWTQFKSDPIATRFEDIPKSERIDLPAYDLGLLAFPLEKLEWGNSAHEAVRNTLITYSVVYLGSYEKNHEEGTGSHLAVDIRMPEGTPVHAISNGKVVKVSTQGNGFGHHVVIKHINVPNPDEPGSFTTLYSAYNHLSDVMVTEGQNVMKGEIIANSGNTGTSTTPHLHLQIDKDSAPWHPYWPFSWKEAQEAGLSFFEAVNAGLGIGNAKEHTVNPMSFIMEHLSFGSVASNRAADVAPPQKNPENSPDILPEPPATPSEITEFSESLSLDPGLLTFKLTGDGIGMLNNGVTIVVKDQQNQLAKMSEDEVIPVKVEGVGQALSAGLKKSDFQNETATLIVKSSEPGLAQVLIGKNAHAITFIEKVENAVALKIEHDGAFIKNEIETVKIVAVDEKGNPAPAINFSGQVVVTVSKGQATVIPNRLNASDFENGVAVLRVKSVEENPLVLKAQNGALVGESLPLRPESGELFSDIQPSHQNFRAIQFLKSEGIVAGYPDGSFKPDKTVNRVEALKMLMLAFNVEATVGQPLPFSDTDNSAWYASTLAAALGKIIVKGYPDGSFRPSQTVNRAEYLKILFNSAGLKFEGELLAKPYDDVNPTDWFAAFAYLANQKNIVDTNGGRLNPADGMTRAGVAETIYRMKMIEKEGLVSYSK